MMSLLSKVTAAGRADLLPGYVLPPLRLKHLGAIEDAAEQRFRDMTAAAAKVATDAAKPVLLEMAEQYIKAGNLLFGMPDLDGLLGGNELISLMVFLALRREHRRITHARVAELLANHDAEPIKRFVLESLGFTFDRSDSDPDEPHDDEPRVPRPTNWRPLMALAHKRGVTQTQFGEMTYLQLDAQIRPMGGKEDAKRAHLKAQRQLKRKRFELFDQVCEDLTIDARQLGMMDTADVATAAARTGKAGRINDLQWLRRYVDEYVAERGK